MKYPTLTPVGDALALLLQSTEATTTVHTLPLIDALGCVLAHQPTATVDVPNYDNSAMDGYALHTDSLTHTNTLPLSQRIVAGSNPKPLKAGTAARIFTGAPVPEGANVVVMQEHAEATEGTVSFSKVVDAGQNIRRQGEDIGCGQKILAKGQRLRPQDIGLAASLGIATLEVFRPITVGIFFTGDELVSPGEPLPAGKLYNSNRYTLTTALTQLGCTVLDLGNIEDTQAATEEALLQAANQADLIITTGGVSVGEEDHVRSAVEAVGQLQLWRLAIKPGKPLAYGEVAGTPFMGLPGNPVSAFVTFCIFACPVIAKMQGKHKTLPTAVSVAADFSWPKPGFRQEYARARLVDGKACLYPHQGSGVLTSTSWADGLVVIPVETTVQKGDMVDYLSFANLLL